MPGGTRCECVSLSYRLASAASYRWGGRTLLFEELPIYAASIVRTNVSVTSKNIQARRSHADACVSDSVSLAIR